jgi:dihydropyrimidinase
MKYDIVIHGGRTWVEGRLVDVDVAISDEQIATIGTNLGPAHDLIDATGRLVLPGGIDVHTHFDTNVGGTATADSYESGTRAAAFGGLTTVLNYAFQGAGERLRDVIEREQAKASGRSYIDYGFHVVVTDATVPGLAEDLAALPDLGCPSIKVFTALDFRLADSQLLDVLAALATKGVLVNVHAEDGALVDFLSAHFHDTGQTGIDRLGPSRPPRAEALAVEKMITYAGATGTPLYIVHLSSEEALDAVRRGRRAGIEIYVETRPAYLYLDDSVYRLPDREGNRFACWPPLRGKDDQAVLWDAVATGEVQCYATDHTTWTLAQKMTPGLPFEQIPGGISNVQTSMGMLYSEGVHTGRIPLSRYVEVTAETPAKLFGLWPRKGRIAAGSDADLTILDPQLRYRVVSADMQSASDFDPYDGYVSTGWPVVTISRGKVVVADQQLTGIPAHGQFLHRSPFRTPSLDPPTLQ